MPGHLPNHVHIFWYTKTDFYNSISTAAFQKVLVIFLGGMKTNVNAATKWNGSSCDAQHNMR